MTRATPAISLLLALAASAGTAGGAPRHRIDGVRITGFHSTDIDDCRPADVALDRAQVRQFFLRGRPVDHRTIHDDYLVAPCYIEGTLRRDGASCSWVVRAAATGYITCGKATHYVVCDGCDDLFVPAGHPRDTP